VGVLGNNVNGGFTGLYVTEYYLGVVSLIDPVLGQKTPIVSGLSYPRHLTWNPVSNQHVWLATVYSILDISLASTPAQSTVLVNSLTTNVDVIPINSGTIVATGTAPELSLIQLSTGYFNKGSPLLMGVGLIPSTAINSYGLATVTVSPYPINCIDSPFGGQITLLINWVAAKTQTATHYAIYFGNTWQTASFYDWLWNEGTQQWVWTSTSTVNTYYYPLRSYGQLWLNNWWGASIDTTTYTSSGLATLLVYFYQQSGSSFSYIAGQSLSLAIDNVYPTAQILSVDHYVPPQLIPQPICAIVQGQSTLFQFQITASDPDQHLWTINLYSIWGNDKSGTVYSDSYSPNHVLSPDTGLWAGLPPNTLVPIGTQWNAWVQGDNTSIQCAHSFILQVWDRTINGFAYIHSASYSQSLTFLLTLKAKGG